MLWKSRSLNQRFGIQDQKSQSKICNGLHPVFINRRLISAKQAPPLLQTAMEKQMLSAELSARELLDDSGCKNCSPHKQPRNRDRSGENFRKRWQTLVKTGRTLHRTYGARIYFSISIPRTRRDFVFRSDKEVLPIMPGSLV